MTKQAFAKLESQVKLRIARIMATAEKLYNIEMPPIDIKFDLRGTALGQAQKRTRYPLLMNPLYCEEQYTIRLNKKAMSHGGNTLDHILNNTLPHEVAHILCYAFPQYGKHHDKGWQRVCLALGGDGNALTELENVVEHVNHVRPFHYSLPSGYVAKVSARIHANIQRGKRYKCNNEPLTHLCSFIDIREKV